MRMLPGAFTIVFHVIMHACIAIPVLAIVFPWGQATTYHMHSFEYPQEALHNYQSVYIQEHDIEMCTCMPMWMPICMPMYMYMYM